MKRKPLDRPKTLLFPPLIPLGALAVGVILGFMLPIWGQTPHLTAGLWLAAGILLGILGLLLILLSVVTLYQSGTSPLPFNPTTRIVTTGPYSFSRNPIYLGGDLLLLGLSFLFYLPWVWAAFLIGLPLNHWGVVLQEEAYLEKKFGKKYLDYKKRVRRWI